MSKIDRLPPDLKAQLITWISDGSWSLAECTEALRDLMEERGCDPAAIPADDSVGRYAKRFSAMLQKQRERHAVAETWIGQFGRLPEGQLGQLIIQMVQGLSFEAGLALDGQPLTAEEMPALVRMLKDLATTVERTERASTLNAERDSKVRAEERAAAAERATAVATRSGLSGETVDAIRREILGLD